MDKDNLYKDNLYNKQHHNKIQIDCYLPIRLSKPRQDKIRDPLVLNLKILLSKLKDSHLHWI